ncbi:MAG: multidrug effflux MFS transporter [Acetobacteraceae bacterium]|nr:multidrug effflux MFS transporter [Acetobacteraceae bacterium]
MRIPWWLPLLLGVLSAVGPLSTDMYLPGFPEIESDFGRPAGTAQITLAAWFAGLAVGQMTQGPLSDRFGRRAPLFAGSLVFTAASAACALAPNLGLLTAARAVAAFGGSACMVIPRAIIRDLAEGHAAARLMSQLMLVMGSAPILAPTLGGAIVAVASWRAIFWICTAFGAFCALLVWLKLPETLAAHHQQMLRPDELVMRFASIAVERGFITHALQGGFAMFGLFAYLSGSPPIFIGMFGLAPERYGIIFGICAAGYIGASQVNARILPRFGFSRVLRAGSWLAVLAAAVLTVFAFAGSRQLVAIALPVFVFMSSLGFVTPNATIGALARHAGQAGTATALMGTMQFLLAAASGLLVGLLENGTARPMACLMLAGAVAALIADGFRPRA